MLTSGSAIVGVGTDGNGAVVMVAVVVVGVLSTTGAVLAEGWGVASGARSRAGCSVGGGIRGLRTTRAVRAGRNEGRRGRVTTWRPRRRAGPVEACGCLCTGPDTAGSCGGIRTTATSRSFFDPSAKGEAGPSPKRTTTP
jgi:hypothetical protein